MIYFINTYIIYNLINLFLICAGLECNTSAGKLCNHGVLDAFQRAGLGFRIGPIFVGSPACADDVALLAGNHQELHTQLLVAENFASKDWYTINPTKSDLLIFNSRHTTDEWNDSVWTSIFSQPIKVVENTVHLGVHRRQKPALLGHERALVNTNSQDGGVFERFITTPRRRDHLQCRGKKGCCLRLVVGT
jgi:hypothetical protein